MKVAIRTDASLQIGTGHVMRCLALADALRERGAVCIFVCRSHAGHLMDVIQQRGHKVHLLGLEDAGYWVPKTQSANETAHSEWLGCDWQTDAEQTLVALSGESLDWLIVDHYALDACWESRLRKAARCIMAIDDLADRPHQCDILLDQNLGRLPQDYSGLLSPESVTLLGPRYALLRPEFAAMRPYSLARRTSPQLRNILITMGGVDKDNVTGKVLQVLERSPLPPGCNITVVMGLHAPWLEQVYNQAEQMLWPTRVVVNVRDMARLMADSDLAIGAAGATSWERCCLGLPTVLLVLADNQRDIAEALGRSGAVLSADISSLEKDLVNVLKHSLEAFLISASRAASSITNGIGAVLVSEMLVEGKPK